MSDDFFGAPSSPWQPTPDRDESLRQLREALAGPAGAYLRFEMELSRWIPARHPADAVLTRNDEGVLVLNGVACYPWGFEFTVSAVPRPGAEMEFGRAIPFSMERRMLEMMPPEVRAQMGIQLTEPRGERKMRVHLSTGETFEVEEMFAWLGAMGEEGGGTQSGPPEFRFLSQMGNHHGPGSSTKILAWGLPPPGPVTLEIEWQALGIEGFTHGLDGAAITTAASRAKPRADFGLGDLLQDS